jgi:hypothetical protein
MRFFAAMTIILLVTPSSSAELTKTVGKAIKKDLETAATSAQKNDIRFTSTYMSLNSDCQDKFSASDNDHDMPVICSGPGGYRIDVEFSACCEHMQVEDGTGFLLILPEQRAGTVMKRKLEWRLANGKPFAVIFRMDKYRGDITLSPEKVSEVLVIKGLNGFTSIDYEVNQKQHSNPNQEARNLADRGYIGLKIPIKTRLTGTVIK